MSFTAVDFFEVRRKLVFGVGSEILCSAFDSLIHKGLTGFKVSSNFQFLLLVSCCRYQMDFRFASIRDLSTCPEIRPVGRGVGGVHTHPPPQEPKRSARWDRKRFKIIQI